MCFPISVQLFDNVILTFSQSGIMWFIFLRFLFFSLTFSFVTPFFFNFGRAQEPENSGQYGECSWYEAVSDFRLPGGQRLHSKAFYAAHRTLPLGSQAVVTNPNNGKTVKVTITDRGPLIFGRVAALSKAAFATLGDLDQKVFDCYVAPAK